MGGVVPALREIPQPVIAAINGPAIGGGMCLALGADLRYAAESAYFANAGITNGLTGSELGITYLLPRSVGTANAAEILLTGRRFEADDALRMGLVSRVVPDDELLDLALDTAEQMCELSPFGLQMTKQCIWANLEITSLQAAIDFENRNQLLGGLHRQPRRGDRRVAREAQAGVRGMTPDVASTAAERAHEAWHALEKRCLVRTADGQSARQGRTAARRAVSASWPFGQVIAAAAAMLGSRVRSTLTSSTAMVRGLERYRRRRWLRAFPQRSHTATTTTTRGSRSICLQLATLTGDARYTSTAMVRVRLPRVRGARPAVVCTGSKGNQSRNTCSTGPTAQVALRLHGRTGETAYLDFAERQMRLLDAILRDDDGLYRDNVDADGPFEPTIWSYNQGTPIGAARAAGSHRPASDAGIDRAANGARRERPLRGRRRLVAITAGVQRDLLPQPPRRLLRGRPTSRLAGSGRRLPRASRGPRPGIGAPGCSSTAASGATTAIPRSTTPG